jgi:signal transduction histidine kinase
MSTPIPLTFRPYARLLTMLGDQLIKNERIALVEIIKNSYDADASWVKVIFAGFGENFKITPQSKITVEDDGTGMTQDILENHWRSPATPVKKLAKLTQNTTPKGRKIQGEKGIGRFAILKLGKTVTITTRPENSDSEYVLNFDFAPYDDDFLTENGEPATLFLEDLQLTLVLIEKAAYIRPVEIGLGHRKLRREPHGTTIEITNLRGAWSASKVEEVYNDLIRLQSIFGDTGEHRKKRADNFEVFIYKDSQYQAYSTEYIEKLHTLIEENSVLRIEHGRYDEAQKEFRFLLNGRQRVLKLDDPDITGLKIFRDYFGEEGELLDQRKTECGPFSFGFYVFDFGKNARGKHALDAEQRKIVKDHRIYLYRDTIRVYPYGDPDDDWLQIDQYRGTVSAGWFLSNDQVVGFVNITQEANPRLIDKTNREGLIDTGNPTRDFVRLLQVFLAWVRKSPYDRYRRELAEKEQNEVNIFKLGQVRQALDALGGKIANNGPAQAALSAATNLYKIERSYLVQRAETTEHLAGVGLSVETASHDIMAVMGRALLTLDSLIRETQRAEELDKELVSRDLSTLRGMLSFVETQLKDVQLLFKSTKQRRREIRIREILDKVHRLFLSSLTKDGIEFSVVERGAPLVAKTTDAVLLQLFLNLFDNAVYWLHGKRQGKRQIEALLDGDDNILIFADNGPGIKPEDAQFIFEPFFSGKGEEGRGLGLYIARQLLDRHDYTIELAELKRHKILPGANFVVSFVKSKE